MARPEQVERRFPPLDGLRGLAVMAVLVHNVGGIAQHDARTLLMKIVFFIQAPGWVGVQLFFVLSGFLITGLLLDSRGRPGALRVFWVRRVLRIFPLYYAVLLGVTVIAPLLFTMQGPFDLRYRAWYWVYLNNWVEPWGREVPAFSPFWSLAVEEQFYLVWPALALTLKPRTLLRVCVALAVAALLVRTGLVVAQQPPLAAYKLTVARMDALTLGSAAAIVLRDEALLARVAPQLRRIAASMVVLLAGMWPFTRGFNGALPVVETVGYGALSLLFTSVVLLVAVEPRGALARAASRPWMRWLGKYSYAIYVFQVPIAYLVYRPFEATINGRPAGPALGAFLALQTLVAGLSLAAALLSWNLLEHPALALKDRLAPRP
jgi:peptidoglycan/LPS O-acetylase OafA/YrhL